MKKKHLTTTLISRNIQLSDDVKNNQTKDVGGGEEGLSTSDLGPSENQDGSNTALNRLSLFLAVFIVFVGVILLLALCCLAGHPGWSQTRKKTNMGKMEVDGVKFQVSDLWQS